MLGNPARTLASGLRTHHLVTWEQGRLSAVRGSWSGPHPWDRSESGHWTGVPLRWTSEVHVKASTQGGTCAEHSHDRQTPCNTKRRGDRSCGRNGVAQPESGNGETPASGSWDGVRPDRIPDDGFTRAVSSSWVSGEGCRDATG